MDYKQVIMDRFSVFTGDGAGIEGWLTDRTDDLVFDRLGKIDKDPLRRSQLNQLLLLGHEAALSEGFYRYYWLHVPKVHAHPYDVAALEGFSSEYAAADAIKSLEHLRWGMYRLFTDALLFFGNIRQAYRALRVLSFQELEVYFRARCINYDFPSGLLGRGPPLPVNNIAKDDRYLISEQACKSYDPVSPENASLLSALETSYKKLLKSQRRRSFSVKELIGGASALQRQQEFEFSAVEFIDQQVHSLKDLRSKYALYKKRFDRSRSQALENTKLYLSLVNDLDVYVATSMRNRDDFRAVANFCEKVFSDARLRKIGVRHFDPTLSAAMGHEDKGLIECLMVKCAKILVYAAGKSDSYGKSVEAAMALSLGKPVIFFCDESDRARFFKDVHPLSRLIDFKSGVAVGVCVATRSDHVATLINRALSNSMEYELVKPKPNYLQLKERLTGSVVRVQTSDMLLRQTFWNHYHNLA